MQVNLEGLTRSVEEELSKLEERKSRLKEGLLAIQTVKHLGSELKPAEGDSSPNGKSEEALAALTRLANKFW